jgi:MFS superfamily sulfate permease-like transporter
VLAAVTGLFKLDTLVRLWRVHRGEFIVAIAALLGVLGSGLLRGVLIGAIISLVLVLRRASRPHVAFLGRIPGARRYSDLARHADNEIIPSVLIARRSPACCTSTSSTCATPSSRARDPSPPPEVPRLAWSYSIYPPRRAWTFSRRCAGRFGR